MKIYLRQKLIDYIKAHQKVHWKQLERYCGTLEARWADNGSRRLRDARDRNNKAYDPNLGVLFYPNSDTIEYYTYGPQPQEVKDWFKPPRISKPLYNFNGELITKRAELNKQNDLRTNTKIPSLFR